MAAGLWLAVALGDEAARLLAEWLGEGAIASVLGRLLPALTCIALCLMAGWGIHRTLEALKLGWLNRLAGALLAGLVGAVLLAVLLGAATRVSPALHEASEGSVLGSRLVALWERAVGPQAGAADASSEEAADGDGPIGR
jgi:uncharacterized membrane protein required for colicin V production